MKITKIGHCCLLVETNGKRILTDPGNFTNDEHVLEDIDLVLITHEHPDHLHVESLTELVAKNPNVRIVTNSGVGKLLTEAGIEYELLEGTNETEVEGVHLKAYDEKHAEIFKDFGQVQNTGYFITERFFYPGDAYAVPEEAVELLAAPVAGPWCRLADVIRYILAVAPKHVFPVHDGLLNEQGVEITHTVAAKNLEGNGVVFTPLKKGGVLELE